MDTDAVIYPNFKAALADATVLTDIKTNTFHIIDTDSTTTAGTTYINCSDGKIRKVVATSDATGSFYGGYVAAVGTTWLNRVSATYTKE